MIKFKSIFLFAAVLFVVSSVIAESNATTNSSTNPLFVSFNGRYTNVVYGGKANLWKDKDKYTFEEIKNECENKSENPDVWYIAGYYWQHIINNRKKAGECYKESMKFAPTAFKPHNSFIEIIRLDKGPKKLFCNLTNLFYKIKSMNNTMNWSWNLIFFRNNNTNQLERLYLFIQKNKEKIPARDYALGKCAMQAGKYESALKHFKEELSKTVNGTKRHNILNELEWPSGYAKNPKLMACRNKILEKYLSPYKYAIQKIEDLRPKHNNSELCILTSNAFVLAKNQRERIIAINDLVNYCYNTERKEIKDFIDKIVAEKNVDPIFANMLVRNMNTINATNYLHSYCTRVIAKMPKKLNAINNLIEAVHADDEGRKRPEADKYILDLIINKFSNNHFILNSVAKKYKKYGCYDDELACRKKMLASTGNKDFISKTKARIAELKLKLGQPVDNAGFLSVNLKIVDRDASAAKVISKFYLKTGKTNDALKILMKCAENKDFPVERKAAAMAVLNTKWGSSKGKAIAFVNKLMKSNYPLFKFLSGKIMWNYIDNGFNEKAVELFVFVANMNDRPYKYDEAIRRLDVNSLVDKLISGKVTNDNVLSSVSYYLSRKDKSAGYKLRNYFLNLPDKNPRKYGVATTMLQYAFDIANTNLCFEIVDKIDGFVKQKIVPKNLDDNLYYYMLKLNLTNKCNSWVEFMLENTDKKKLTDDLYSYSKWYMRIGETNKLINLVVENSNTNLPTDGLLDLLHVYKYLNDTNQYKLYVETIGTRLINYNMVRMYGVSYLDKLNYLSRYFGEKSGVKIDDFIQKWFYNDKVNIDTKFSLLYRAKSNKMVYVNCLAKNKCELSAWRLMEIAGMFIRYGSTNKGIEFYSYVLNNSKANDDIKINTILNLAPIYINNKDCQAAKNVLSQLSQFDLTGKYCGFFSNLGNLYVQAFMYLKAVDCYIMTINRAENIRDIWNAVIRISEAWPHDSEIEYSKLAEINFTNKNEVLNYTAKALFLLLDNNSSDAEKYILKAEEKLKTNKEKYVLWNSCKNIAQLSNNYETELLSHKKMIHYNENQNYIYHRIYDINRLLRKATNYAEIISFNSDVLNVVTNEKTRGRIILNICDAYLRLVDTNAAWETVLQSNDPETIKRLAYRINRSNEMMQEFEKRIENSNSGNFATMAITLSQYNWNNRELSEKLASLLDKKLPEINVRDYVGLSMIYLNCGYRDKAKHLLEIYVDNLDEKYQKEGSKMIDKYLDLKWRHSLHSRGYIPISENLKRMWGRR